MLEKFGFVARLGVVLCLGFLCMAAAQAQEWTPPAPLNSYAASDSGSDDENPEIATDGAGNWVTVWERRRSIYTAYSSDMGLSWTTSHVLDDGTRTDYGQQPHVVYAGSGKWVAFWNNVKMSEDGASTTWTVLLSKSTDGKTWSLPEEMDVDGNNPRSLLDVDTDSSGTIVATNAVQFFRSTDCGQTWTLQDTNIYGQENPPASYSHVARIAFAGSGKWVHAVTTRIYNYHDPEIRTTLKVWHSSDNAATWSLPETLSSDASLLSLDASNDTIVIAVSKEQPTSQNFLHFMTSVNGGNTWTTNEPLGELTGGVFRLAVDDDGNWLFVGYRVTPFQTRWDHDIIAMRSTDPADNWTSFVTIVKEGVADEINASVASDGDGGYVIAFQSADAYASPLEEEYDIKAVHSVDAGTTWTVPVYVNDDALSDLPHIDDSFVRLKFGENDTVLAVWPYAGNGKYTRGQVMWARSADAGQTWSNAKPILPDIQMVFSPELYYRGNGKWFVWWQGNPNALCITSVDNGVTWTEPGIFFGYAAADSGNHGTVMKAHMAGTIPEQYGLARLEPGAQYWDEPTTITDKPGAIAHSRDLQWFSLVYPVLLPHSPALEGVYTSSDDGRTWLKEPSINQPPPASQLVSDHAGTVVAVWYDTEYSAMGLPRRVYVSKTSDNGLSWTAPAELGRTGFSSGYVRAAYAGSGRWIVVWDAEEDRWAGKTTRVVASVSYDNAETWSNPAKVATEGYVPADVGHGFPDVAASEGKVVIGWETRNEYGNTDDIDLYYSYGVLNPPLTAAKDWQLFE